MDNVFGSNVKYYRETAGLTQGELAERIGYKHKSSLSLIESGKGDVGTKEVVAIANALGVDVTDLLNPQSPEQRLINEYLQDKDLRRLILFAGGHLPKDSREKYVEAVINAINAMNSVK